MTFAQKIALLKRVDLLINRKATGSPTELAERIGVSERHAYKIIRLMKDWGGPIFYDQYRRSYCYRDDVQLHVGYLNKRRVIEKRVSAK